MDPPPRPGVPLTAFDPHTAEAVVEVLNRAGVQAWPGPHSGEETDVMVARGSRDEALRVLGSRMEEVRLAALERDATRANRPGAPDPGTTAAEDGRPLVTERLRNLRILAAVILVPLLVVTLAPTLRGEVRIAVLAVAVVLGLAIWLHQRR